MSPCGPALCYLLGLNLLSGNEATFISLTLYCIAQKGPWNPLLNISFSETLPAFIYHTAFPVVQFSLAVISFSQIRLRSRAVCLRSKRKRKELYKGQSDVRYTPEPNNWNVPQHVCLNPELYSVKWHSFIWDPVEMKGPPLCVSVMRPHDTVVPCALSTVRTYICLPAVSATQRNCHIRWVSQWPAGERLIFDDTWCFDIVAVALEEWTLYFFVLISLFFCFFFFKSRSRTKTDWLGCQ